MNAIAGVLIGYFNESWPARIIVPFIWGIAWCATKWILNLHKDVVVNKEHSRKWGMSWTQAYYFIEYSTAAATSLIFSVITGLVKSFFL